MHQQTKLGQARRLSVITDILIFFLILILALILISIFDIDIKFSDNEYEELALVSNLESSSYSVEEENMYYISQIKEKYNIIVSYGENTKNSANKVDATVQENELIVNNNLKILLDALKKYPQDLFKVINHSNYSINIYLVNSFNNDNLALASRNNLNEYKIYISNNSKFERSFHHEMYHILEYFMKSKNPTLANDWFKLNPSEFSYTGTTENLNRDYVYYVASDLKNAYFVSKYSKVSDKEDRAEVFSEIMVMDTKKEYLNNGENIYKKANYITNDLHKFITQTEFYIDKIMEE